MDIQLILVFVLFALAAIYIGRMIYKAVTVKNSGCGSNCKCGVDFNNVPTGDK